MSSVQVAFWLEYYNIVLNNNTAKTNCYQMLFSLFFIIDNNTRFCLITQVFVSDKTSESYK